MAQKKIYRLRNIGTKGIVNDIPPYDLSPDTMSAGNNVRFEAGRIQKIGGWVPVVAEPTGYTPSITKGMPDELPLALINKPQTALGSHAIIYGTPTHLWQAAGLSHSNISKSGATYKATPEHRWEYTNLSNVIIFTNELEDQPQALVPGVSGGLFADMPGWGHDTAGVRQTDNTKPNYGKLEWTATAKTWRTPVIRAYKNYLVALSTYEDGVDYPQRVRWSDVALPSQLPENWSAQDTKSVAGFNDLSNATGTILDGLALRDSLIIYTDEDTFAMDLVGGNFKFNFRKIFPESGILVRGCVTEFEGKHFVITKNDIIIHDGSSIKPVAASRVKDFLMHEITQTNYRATRCFTNTTRKEIWITYVGAGKKSTAAGVQDTYSDWACNKVAIWNWQYDTWTYADLPDTFDMTLAVPPDTDKRQWDGYSSGAPAAGGNPATPGDEWGDTNHAKETWSNEAKTFANNQLIAATNQKCFMALDVGRVQTTVTYNRTAPAVKDQYTTTTIPVLCSVERSGLDLDEQEADISYNKMFRSIYPQMGGTGKVLFTVGGSQSPMGTIDWDSSDFFEIGQDYKVDCWSNHKYLAIRIEDANEGDWNFTGFDVDYVTEGNR